jgi:hypothetical protein
MDLEQAQRTTRDAIWQEGDASHAFRQNPNRWKERTPELTAIFPTFS